MWAIKNKHGRVIATRYNQVAAMDAVTRLSARQPAGDLPLRAEPATSRADKEACEALVNGTKATLL